MKGQRYARECLTGAVDLMSVYPQYPLAISQCHSGVISERVYAPMGDW